MAPLSAWSWACDLAGYCADRGYLGALAGRHANRIAGGRFKLDGRIHQLTLNEHGRTHLHGGLIGFSRRGWRILEHTDASVTLGLTSPMSEEGYPGTLEASCTDRLVDPGTLSIHMTAEADLPTIVNFVHHSSSLSTTANRSATTFCRLTPSLTPLRTPN
jgi:aldose 1-epimerase